MTRTRNLDIPACKVGIRIGISQGCHESQYIWKVLAAQRVIIIEK